MPDMYEVNNYIRYGIGLENDDKIVVGVSGGPDSMALLDILKDLRDEYNLFLVCAHVNHNKRPESEQEKKNLEEYCKTNNILFEYIKINQWGEDNFHNEARSARYNFFEKIINKYNAKYLMTAHHADDLIETILMRIVRGSTLKGYSGFSRFIDKGNYYIVRPLITKTKEELLEYVNYKKINYAIDESNNEDHYTRNRYRHTILPFLKSEDKNVHKKFLKYSDILIEASEFIDNESKKVFNKVVQDGIINIEEFNLLNKIIQTKIIYNILEKIYEDDLLIVGDVHVNLIYSLIKSNKSNSLIHLPNNVVVTKSYNELSFNYNDKVDDLYEIELSGEANLPNGKNIEFIEDNGETSNFVIRLNSKEVLLPLYVRNKRDGDKIEVKGMNGTKKVNHIFIDNKIKLSDRSSWPIVLDAQDNVIWVPGLKKSKLDKEIGEEYDIILRYY